jgi:flagellar protein FliO/FliZ
MQFLTNLLGGPGNSVITSVLALGIVLVLILAGLWTLKFFMGSATALRPQGRRLAVVEQIQIDPKRKLLIIRRDNVDHLIMTGGGQDLVVEANIPVQPKVTQPPRPAKGTAAEDAAVSAPTAGTVPDDASASVSRSHIGKLREYVRPEKASNTPSLRHTGLLRRVSIMEPAPRPILPITGDNLGRNRADSATTSLDNGERRGALGAKSSFGEDGAADSH